MLNAGYLTDIYEILKGIHFFYQSEKIYNFLLEHLLNAIATEAGSLFIIDPVQKRLILRGSIGPRKSTFEIIAEEVPFPYGKGICGWVAENNKPLMLDDVFNDHRFNTQVDTLTGFRTKSVLCVPITFQNKVLGIIELINKQNAPFDGYDLEFVRVVADQAAVALENSRLYRELIQSKQLIEGILSNLTGAVLCVDTSGQITHLNPEAEKILSVKSSEAIGRKCDEFLKAFPQIPQYLVEILQSKKQRIRERFVCSKNGNERENFTVGYSTFLVQNSAGDIFGAGMTFQNLSHFNF